MNAIPEQYSNLVNAFELAASHIHLKEKLCKAILNRETLDAVMMSKGDCCEFSQLLCSDSVYTPLSHFHSYRDCVAKHAAFHIQAGKIVELINAKEYEQAQELLNDDLESDFNEASRAVISAVVRLKEDVIAQDVASIHATYSQAQ